MDASTGDRIALTTDYYQVTDWEELARILDSQDDVGGDRGEGWNRFVELKDGRAVPAHH